MTGDWIQGETIYQNAWGRLIERDGTYYVWGHRNGERLLHQGEDLDAAWEAFDRWEAAAKRNPE